MFNGYPKFVERNKIDGSPFQSTIGAEIKYCRRINVWVFSHPHILVENECSWLWRSSETLDFDVMTTANTPWEAWVGELKPQAQVSMTCNECSALRDCSYHGSCNDNSVCICDEMHFGDTCAFTNPCPMLVTEKAQRIGELVCL